MIQKQKKKTWKWFSKYIRVKHSDENGYCTCYTCGRVMKWNDRNCQAGHGIGGRTNNILFNEDIVRPQCYGCNVCGYGRLDEFADKLEKEIGRTKYKKILKSKREIKKYTEKELKEMEKHYKDKFFEIIEEKNLEYKEKRKYKEITIITAKLYPTRTKSKKILKELKNE